MNDLFLHFGIESWKPAIAVLLLPPVPFIVLVLLGARVLARRWALGWLLVLLGTLGLWLGSTWAVGNALTHWLVTPPRVLTQGDIEEIRRAPKTAIVVLGGGRRLLAPEYGVSQLNPRSIERLRYAVWLARETQLPLAFSGGVGHGAPAGPTEAEIAARVAEREFRLPLRWTEAESRDTRENAIRSVALLHAQGIEQIVLVTHDYHMRRAARNFSRAIERAGVRMDLVAAPMGLPASGRLDAMDWMPTSVGFERVRLSLHEWIGLLAGA